MDALDSGAEASDSTEVKTLETNPRLLLVKPGCWHSPSWRHSCERQLDEVEVVVP
jgi:hypothetical protein